MKKKDNKTSLGLEEYKILVSPDEPLVKYRGLKFATKTDIIIYKNQSWVNANIKWINVQAFKLYYDKKYYIQCLYIKNTNAINKREILIFSQSFNTNFGTILPFLIDLSNYLRINIITYQYNIKDKEEMNYLDVNLLYNYLNKLDFVKSIILLGLSVGNKINMNILLSKTNLYPKTKLKAIILISPTWVYNLSDIKNIKNSKLKNDNDKFIRNVNLYNIPVFIIHGKKDTKVKYFLSMSFSQQIQKKLEWFPKNGNHYDIINAHRSKLLLKVKQFLLMNDLLKKVENDPYLMNKIRVNDLNLEDMTIEDKDNAMFNNSKQKNKDDDYYGYYNSNDIMGSKKKINVISNNNNDNGIYIISQPKIKNENDITLNQDVSFTDNQSYRGADVTLNHGNNLNDVSLGGGNLLNENDITINENTIDFGDESSKMDVSFLPGDIIPSFVNRSNTMQSFDDKKMEDDVSFM